MRVRSKHVFLFLSFIPAIFASPSGWAAANESPQILFEIGGKQFSVKDLPPAEQTRLHEMQLNYYKTIEGLARQRFVEFKSSPHQALNNKEKPFAAEEKWLGRSFEPNSSEIDKALETFKDEKQLQQLPIAERGKVMSRYLASQKRMKVLTEVTDKALETGEIKVSLRRPETPVVEISKSPQAVIGDAKNSIRVVEFTDFQCPYCKKFAAVSGEVLKKYGSRIVWEVRHFPLSFHKQAREAAAAVYCASVQGKLVEGKKWVFDAQDKLAEEKIFTQMSKALALKESDFDKCRTNENTLKIIDADLKEGERIGVSGTPTVFVNGRRFEGDPQSMDAWDAMIKSVRPSEGVRSL